MLIGAIKVKSDNTYKNIFLAGIIFGLAYTIRVISVILVGTGLITLLFGPDQSFKKKVYSSLFLISGFLIVLLVVVGLGAVVSVPSDPTTGIQNSLLMGTNFEHKGQ